ncbi:hypothetical protein [Allopusillimonas ginsengisoli]|uniref:hypothetical protein n=1 Tax=Allopusillimonas ginsengisoli TaxID=453575 RepID=UPI00101F16BD|nr:hypothetical protein [Allopusillimonas ginsengisoli]TEA78870.1 hypothetical protein ERE07_05565 [Allopusillimonas ginsengisoli]
MKILLMIPLALLVAGCETLDGVALPAVPAFLKPTSQSIEDEIPKYLAEFGTLKGTKQDDTWKIHAVEGKAMNFFVGTKACPETPSCVQVTLFSWRAIPESVKPSDYLPVANQIMQNKTITTYVDGKHFAFRHNFTIYDRFDATYFDAMLSHYYLQNVL